MVRWAGVEGNGTEHRYWGWWFLGSGFGNDSGRYIRGVVKSPQFGLILAKRACSDLT